MGCDYVGRQQPSTSDCSRSSQVDRTCLVSAPNVGAGRAGTCSTPPKSNGLPACPSCERLLGDEAAQRPTHPLSATDDALYRLMTHLAMLELDNKGNSATWGPQVIDEEYAAAPAVAS